MTNVDIDMYKLISLIEERPTIWDKTAGSYKDRTETKCAWNQIFRELNSDFEELNENEKDNFGKEVMRKWANVRDAFSKSVKKRKYYARTKAYVYNKQLQFLLPELLPEHESKSSLAVDVGQLEITDDETVQNSPQTFRKSRSLKRNLDHEEDCPIVQIKQDQLEPEIHQNVCETPDPDRHLCFFKSVIPSLANFSDDEVLEFQITVLQTISSMKQRRKNS